MESSAKERVFVITQDPQINYLLDRILAGMGHVVIICNTISSATERFEKLTPTLVIISEHVENQSGMEFSREIFRRFPAVPIIVFAEHESREFLKNAMDIGISGYLVPPLRTGDIQRVVDTCIEKSTMQRKWVLKESRRATASLQQKLDELEIITRLGHAIHGSLNLDSVLTAIIDAAVELTGAEEGSLLLLDEDTGELYMRAAKNFQEEFVRTFRLPIKDTLAGSVLQSGKPVLLDPRTPEKIKTEYLVKSLVYVPIQLNQNIFGVLGVDNRVSGTPFSDRDVKLLSAISEYAVIAIENARLYSDTTQERNKLETILTRIKDGVIVLDQENKVLLVNKVAQKAFNLSSENLIGKPIQSIFRQKELIKLLENKIAENNSEWDEYTSDDEHTYSIQVNPIPDVGIAITMSDITYLKKLDRIKSDFVNTVSHDLRSPLTAIMGYVDLIERVGPVNKMQSDFIRRVQISVQNITSMVDDLLNLGRIEAGFDTGQDVIQLDAMIKRELENLENELKLKKQSVDLSLAKNIPKTLGNSVQIRQLLNNIINNASKYTPEDGTIKVKLEIEQDQLIFQVSDNGVGIPPVDLPFIFDKFYRASNISPDIGGTGLGLSIVKSIVEAHKGRVWVDSKIGSGSTFTVVMPIISRSGIISI
ncbi:MAG: GAF domain-containing protein, partial [Anaerolineaceae bacterium]|nr:GAF domain-containing protein [Anaerolineaceae bacterium]